MVTLDTWLITPDLWHLTWDTWHVTPDMWNIAPSSDLCSDHPMICVQITPWLACRSTPELRADHHFIWSMCRSPPDLRAYHPLICVQINPSPVFQSGKSDQMVSASSVLELEVNHNMFWNRLTRTYMWPFITLHTLLRKWTLSLFWGGGPPKEKI